MLRVWCCIIYLGNSSVLSQLWDLVCLCPSIILWVCMPVCAHAQTHPVYVSLLWGTQLSKNHQWKSQLSLMSYCDIGCDSLQKPCSQVKSNSLQHKFNEHLFCAHPAMLSRSWHHHWYFKWLFVNSSIRLKNRGLLHTLPAHPSLARSLILL